MSDRFIFEYHGRDHLGLPVWSCRRPTGGLIGYGIDNEHALADFEEKENELAPLPKGRLTNLGNPQSGPEWIDEPNSRYED